MINKKGLGRGLESLISGIEQREIRNIPLKNIKPNPFQPRTYFDENELKDLTASIKENGVIQPIIVRKKKKHYEIIAGERRYRASVIAKLKDIPAVVKDISDEKMLEFAIIENIQRENLNPIDEASGYKELVDKFDLTHEEIGKKVGKSRAHITNIMRILELENKIKNLIVKNKLSLGHAKVLLSIKDKHSRIVLAEHAVTVGLSVRDLEKIVNNKNTLKKKILKKRSKENLQIEHIIDKLIQKLDRKVDIKYKKGKGKIVLEFYNDKDFIILLEKLGIKKID